jgi:hypothetical protein
MINTIDDSGCGCLPLPSALNHMTYRGHASYVSFRINQTFLDNHSCVALNLFVARVCWGFVYRLCTYAPVSRLLFYIHGRISSHGPKPPTFDAVSKDRQLLQHVTSCRRPSDHAPCNRQIPPCGHANQEALCFGASSGREFMLNICFHNHSPNNLRTLLSILSFSGS